ncbi:MAG: hypothetical protein IIB40_00260 [Candidatus Marinimicrobia bacterium]|nr:hypothetical protein [Candidatus Neomarinimicrobiota bacterium]MCH7954787.1 hypothetical protein [Candidatus Neomarinimicrobiota bacterium]
MGQYLLWQSGLVLTPFERRNSVRINPDSHGVVISRSQSVDGPGLSDSSPPVWTAEPDRTLV